MSDAAHVHDCTGADLTCPCGYVFRIPRFWVSIEIAEGGRELINEHFNCETVQGAVAALRRAGDKLDGLARSSANVSPAIVVDAVPNGDER